MGGGAARTLGYYEPGDGGGAIYNIIEDDTLVDDGGSVHDLDNGLKAKLIIKNGTINIKQFGCKSGDSTFNNTPKLRLITQYFSNTGGRIFIPKEIFYVDITDNYCIRLYSNMEIYGGGTLKLFPQCQRGNTFILGTPNNDTEIFSNIYIHNITIDGSSEEGAYTNRNLNNLCLWNASNSVIENVTSINAIFCAIMIRNENSNNDYCFNNKIINNHVYNARYIGIQTTHDSNVVISGNTVDTTGDNCIDIYGNNTNQSQVSPNYNIVVSNNVARYGKAGIFIESIPWVVCEGNTLRGCESGIAINRIHSGANYCICANNILNGEYDSTDSNNTKGLYGFWIVNQNYGCNIHDNIIANVKTGIWVDRMAYSVIDHNEFTNINDLYLIAFRNSTTYGFQRRTNYK